MKRWFLGVGGWVALAAAVALLIHVRGIVVGERYALGQAVEFEGRAEGHALRLRERWERATQPARLRERAQALGLQPPTSAQVLR
jgi:hypothetical protein